MEKEKKDNSFMMKLSTLIVDKRKGFYLVFIRTEARRPKPFGSLFC